MDIVVVVGIALQEDMIPRLLHLLLYQVKDMENFQFLRSNIHYSRMRYTRLLLPLIDALERRQVRICRPM